MNEILLILQSELHRLPIVNGATYEMGMTLRSVGGREVVEFRVDARLHGQETLFLRFRILPEDLLRETESYPTATRIRRLVTQMSDDIQNKWGAR